ncbi:tRNA-processing ribonuclease [Escherichia coli]|nr:tRNA-processing ribonuclease [Escherichia coli]
MTQENEIKRPTQDLEHEPIKQLDNSEKGGKVSQALETVTTTAEKVQRQPVIAHLIRATERFNDRLGNQFWCGYHLFLIFIDDPDFDGVVCRRGLCAGLPSDVATGYLRQNSAKHQRSDASRHVEKTPSTPPSAAYDCRACRPGGGALFWHQLDG